MRIETYREADEPPVIPEVVEDERCPLQAALKMQILELLIQHDVAYLDAHGDGSGDDGSLESVTCCVEPHEGSFEPCETPEGVEDLVGELHDMCMSGGYEGNGGFFNLTINTKTRECSVERGWYYTESNSSTETETL